MKLNNDLIVDINERAIGPRHDPYSATTLTIKRGDMTAQRYRDGLGRESVMVLKGSECVAGREWFHDYSNTNKNKCNRTYANLIVRKHLGISCDDAEQQYQENWTEDPMGSPASYM